jgi:peptide/nickel transport system permease protein
VRLSQSALRIVYGLAAAFGAVTLVFFLSRMTSDPAQLLAPPGSTPDQVESLRSGLGLDRSLLAQYGSYLSDLAHGDLGTSYWLNDEVVAIIGERIGATVSLAAVALVLALGIGVPAGLLAAFRQERPVDRVLVSASMLGNAVPTFWMGPVLILLFAVQIPIFPASGRSGVASYILPALALAGLQGAILFRVTRGAALEVLSQEQVKLARAKGSGELRVARSHVLPNTLLPVLTMAGLAMANLLSSAIVVEVIFSWPGIGQTLIEAVRQRDFPLVQGITIVFALAYVGINTAVDLLYQFVDPRLRQAA